jgi:hypothetical protein
MTMRQLNVKLSRKQHEALRRYASRRRTPVAWVIKDYIDNLAGRDSAGRVRAHESTQLAARGGSFDWLSEEPDLYSEADGEPVGGQIGARR